MVWGLYTNILVYICYVMVTDSRYVQTDSWAHGNKKQ